MYKPLVILHGWGIGAKSFEKLAGFLKSHGCQPEVIELPGFGNTPPPDKPWSVEDYCNFVLQKAKSKNLERFDLFGHSFGGRIAIKLTALHPEKIDKLILCDAAGITPRSKAKLKLSLILSKFGRTVFSFSLFKKLREPARKLWYFMLGKSDYYRLNNDVMRETFKNVVSENLTSHLSQIQTPALIIWGVKDKITPVADAYLMNRNIVQSRLELLENIGHSPHLEAPQKLAEIAAKFINQ